MKTHIRNTFTLLLLAILISSCGDDTVDISSKDAFIKSLTGTWVVEGDSYVILDDQDITDVLTGFEITINEDLSFTANSDQLDVQPLPWPTFGSFSINDALTQLTRDDGLIITATIDENDFLSLSFQFAEGFDDSSGRLQAIQGDWVFNLKKK